MKFAIESYTGNYINKTKNHLYIAPSEELKGVVAHYTITFPNQDVDIPKGSVLNLIPDMSGCFVVKFFDKLSIMVWGPTTKVVTVANDLKTANCRFFVEFLPTGLYQVLGMNVHTLLDKKVLLEELYADLYKEINERIQAMNSFDEIIIMMNEILTKQVEMHPINAQMMKCIEAINRCHSEIQVADVAKDLGISERQLLRYANQYVGMGMKKYAKFVSVNQLMHDLVHRKLIDITYDYRYFDQAHFSHAFKDVCGITPKKYIENLSEFYNELYKF